MDWFDYYRKVSLAQFVRDARELRALRGQLRQAENDLEHSTRLLTKDYGIEDDINHGDACLKIKEIIEPTNLIDESARVVLPFRVVSFLSRLVMKNFVRIICVLVGHIIIGITRI